MNKMSGTEETQVKKFKYPKSVFYIISNGCCERLAYHGMRVLLVLYFRDKLKYSDSMATVIYHVFTMLAAFFPIIGAIMADLWQGKYKTILYLSIIATCGQALLSAAAVPILQLPIRELTIVGLIFIAIGSGGVKPCITAFGGEQFILPQQQKYLLKFFSVFYFIINLGSLGSALLTPELRSGIQCFGQQTCESVAFLFPTVLMLLSIVLIVLGKPLYKIKNPEGNVMLDTAKCISHAITNKFSSNQTKREHWLDYAEDKFDTKFISDIKALIHVLTLLIPLPFFWALYEQQGSSWTFQATRMDCELGGYFIKPDQMQVIGPFFIVLFIPIFEMCIYPIMAKIRFLNTPLKKLTTGGFLAGVAFVVSALIELQLEKTYPILPTNGLAQLRIFNPNNCSVTVNLDNETFMLDSFEMWQNINIKVDGSKSMNYTVDLSKCGLGKKSGKLDIIENTAMSYVLEDSAHGFIDYITKSSSGNPIVKLITYNNMKDTTTTVKLIQNSEVKQIIKTNLISQAVQSSSFIEINRGVYDVEINGKIIKPIIAKQGGVYTMLVHLFEENVDARLITIISPNSMHVVWLIPQYILIIMAEVLFGITGLEFAFTQAPMRMKSLVQAGWLFTMAIGNLIVIIIEGMEIFDNQKYKFYLFAALMFMSMTVFGIMAVFYKYVIYYDEDDNDKSINIPTHTEPSENSSRSTEMSEITDRSEDS